MLRSKIAALAVILLYVGTMFFIFTGIHITLASILKEIQENEIEFNGGESTLCKLLKSMNFSWKKVDGRRFLLDRPDIVIQRRDFLRTYHELKTTGATFIFIDETWIFAKGNN